LSVLPPTPEATRLIDEETSVWRGLNEDKKRINEYQMSNEGILSIIFQFKRKSAAIPSFGILRFDIRYFTVRCLNPTRSRSGRI
jgi:hypothetical protein